MATVEEHVVTSRDLLAKAEKYVVEEDLLQASEKGWDAAAHMVKGLAKRKRWQHGGHRALNVAVNRLARETGDDQLNVLFSVAASLHANFYEDWMPQEMVSANLIQVRQFLDRLEGMV